MGKLISTFHDIPEFARRGSKPRTDQENRAIPCVLLPLMRILALFSRSLFLGSESLLGILGRIQDGMGCEGKDGMGCGG